ncbi:MAG TPA: glycosyltransferase family 2 protein [Solirubrobacteraceae bacterium]|nr:glycosyltransferase family 2 protein [Solirubrobacteraceae bacterium]
MSPAVSVAIPTFNRRETLRRAVESALAQTHEDLEVVVSDNASTDGTEDLLRELGRDGRLRVVRQPVNRGMVANLDAVLRLTRGDAAMLLSDDDWLDPRCVELALAALNGAPGRVAALGRVAYVGGDREVEAGQPAPLTADDPARRVRDYFAAVGRDRGNTWFYALARGELLRSLPPLRDVLGFDWLRVAELAFCGRIATVDETLLFRELGGVSETTARNVRESRLPRLHAKVPHLVIAGQAFADVAWRSPVYAPLGARRRLALAAACAAGVPARNARHVLFHIAPSALQRRWHARA